MREINVFEFYFISIKCTCRFFVSNKRCYISVSHKYNELLINPLKISRLYHAQFQLPCYL
jgi:hypothetical protein